MRIVAVAKTVSSLGMCFLLTFRLVTPNETPVRDETFRSVQERPSVAFAAVMPYASCVRKMLSSRRRFWKQSESG